MIKIAFVIDTIESPTAGTEKQLLMLIKYLDRSRFQPYLCVLRTSEWLENEFRLCPFIIVGINSFKNISGLKGVFSLSQFFRNEKVDIVQTHFRDSSIAGILAARLAGVKTIIGTRRNQGYWLTPFEMKIQRWLDRWVSTYIVNSQSTKNWVAENEGVDNRRVEIVNNGFDFSLFPADLTLNRKQMRISLGIKEHVPVVVIVANLRPVKDHGTFLKAAKIVHHRFPDARFLVVGSGPELQKLKVLSSELGIDHVVNFLGARTDVTGILAACDIGVLSSLSESFSNAVVEYMAAGLPVVSTNVGGTDEAVDDGVNGYIVPTRDWENMGRRLVDLLNTGKAVEMGQEGRRRSREKFALTAMVDKTENLFIRCITGKS